MNEADTIGGFPEKHDHCNGCSKPLLLKNAWMTDGCPCNSRLGINSMNETRWRLLMQLQQNQSREIERLKNDLSEAENARQEGLIQCAPTCGRSRPMEECVRIIAILVAGIFGSMFVVAINLAHAANKTLDRLKNIEDLLRNKR